MARGGRTVENGSESNGSDADTIVMERTHPKTNFQMMQIVNPFEGKDSDNIKFFLTQFDELGKLANWTENEKIIILKQKLRGKALQYLHSNEQLQNETKYTTLCTKLIEKYDKKNTVSHNQAQLKKIVQKPGISIRDLADQVQSATFKLLNVTNYSNKDVTAITDKIMMAKFLEALKPKVRLEVKKQSKSDDTFDRVVAIAECVNDAYEEECDEQEINTLEDTENVEKLLAQAQIQSLQSQIDELKRKESQQIKPSCLACGKPHLLIHCWHFKNMPYAQHKPQEHLNNFPSTSSFSTYQNNQPQQRGFGRYQAYDYGHTTGEPNRRGYINRGVYQNYRDTRQQNSRPYNRRNLNGRGGFSHQ